MADLIWVRRCQECGTRQVCKPPAEYKTEAWRDLACKRCRSIALDYGATMTQEEFDRRKRERLPRPR